MRRSLPHFAASREPVSFVKRSLFLAVAGVIAGSSLVIAQDQPAAPEKSAKATEDQIEAKDQTNADTSSEDCLDKLRLTDKQKDQIRDINTKYDRAIQTVWKKFGDRYLETIKLESVMLASIEDNFTDTQRQRIRDRRRKTAQHEQVLGSDSNVTNADSTKSTDTASKEGAPTSKNVATAPVSSETVKDDLADLGVILTDEQESIADNVHRAHRGKMRELNGSIRQLHARLLSLESDKLASIESVLTDDQLSELRTLRKPRNNARASVTRK